MRLPGTGDEVGKEAVSPRPLLAADLLKATGDDVDGADLLRLALRQGIGHQAAGDGDQGEVHRAGDIGEARVGLQPGDFGIVRIDGIDGGGGLQGDDLLEDSVDITPVRRDADNRY